MQKCLERNNAVKQKLSVIIPFVVVSFLPVLALVLHPFRYSVSLFSYEILSAVSAIICIASCLFLKNTETKKGIKTLSAFLPLIQLINTVIYVIESKSALTAVFMAVCFISCAVISKKIITSDKAKIFSVTSSSLMLLVMVLFSFVTVFFGSFSVNTVVDTVYSPNGEYYAEIVDSDQGATGASTVVYAKKAKSLNLLLLEISKTPERIYIGEWREYETMSIEWKNESTLLINSAEYDINT